MTIAGASLSGTDRSSRRLLFASLALNLFFIGIGGALLVRGTGLGSTPEAATIDRSVGGRVARIAATLPGEDGDMLHTAYQANRSELDDTNNTYRRAQDRVRETLRAQPFDVAALRTAMTAMQTARQDYDRRLQDFFARLAADISPAGRQKLADWRNSRRETTPARPAGDGGR